MDQSRNNNIEKEFILFNNIVDIYKRWIDENSINIKFLELILDDNKYKEIQEKELKNIFSIINNLPLENSRIIYYIILHYNTIYENNKKENILPYNSKSYGWKGYQCFYYNLPIQLRGFILIYISQIVKNKLYYA